MIKLILNIISLFILDFDTECTGVKKRYSVVIPTYNRKNHLVHAIESVLGQTFNDLELIVVDDGSSDGTCSVVESYSDFRIKYVRIPHKGVSFARNTGIRLAEGEYIAFLDSDDRWLDNKLEITEQYIDRYPEIFLFHTEELWYRKGKLLGQKKKHRKYSGYIYEKCLPLCCIGMSTTIAKRELFLKSGMFDTALPACEDYDLWLRVCSEFEVKLIPEALTVKDGGRDDQLSNQPGLDRYRVYALEKMLNSTRLTSEHRDMTYKELVHKCKIYANGARRRRKYKEADFYFDKIVKYKSRDR